MKLNDLFLNTFSLLHLVHLAPYNLITLVTRVGRRHFRRLLIPLQINTFGHARLKHRLHFFYNTVLSKEERENEEKKTFVQIQFFKSHFVNVRKGTVAWSHSINIEFIIEKSIYLCPCYKKFDARKCFTIYNLFSKKLKYFVKLTMNDNQLNASILSVHHHMCSIINVPCTFNRIIVCFH